MTRRPNLRVKRRLAVVSAAMFAALAAPCAVNAAEWTLAPDLRVGTISNDNNRLSETGQEIVVWGGFADLAAVAQRRTEVSDTSLRPRFVVSRYPGDEDEDAESAFLDFITRTRGLRHQWEVRGNLAVADVLRGEFVQLDFPDPDLDNPDTVGTGRVNVRRTRTLWRLAPRFSYDLSERTAGGVGLDYTDVSYDKQRVGEAIDYNNARADAFVLYRMSPVSRFRTTLFASNYESEQINNDSTAYGLRARYEHDVGETTRLFLDVGGQRTTVEIGGGQGLEATENGFLLDAGVSRRWERTRVAASGGRSVLPDGSGFLREVDRLRFNVVHDFTARWYLDAAAALLRTRSLEGLVTSSDRDSYEIRATLGYDITTNWSVEAQIGRLMQDYLDDPGEAEANEYSLAVRYSPRGKVWSR
jgi:hypothetical protein